MTKAHDNANCGTCRRLGLHRKAHRIMPNGTTRCDEHYREEWGLPQLNNEARAFIERCHELEREIASRKERADATQVDRCGPRENAKSVARGIDSDSHRPAVSRQRKSGKKNPHRPGHRYPLAHQTTHAVTVSDLRSSWEEL